MRGTGIHKAIPGPHWRSIIQGLFEGWEHIYLIAIGHAIVGHAAFQDHSQEDRRAEVVIAVHPEHHRKGVGYAALEQLMEIGIQHPSEKGLGLECIWASMIEDNYASKALFEKCGFKQVGAVPDFYRLSNKRYAKHIYHANL